MKTRTFDVLPMGLCGTCLEAMVDPARGQAAIHEDLGEGRSLWAVYCEHNRSGAQTFDAPGHATQWTLHTPIDIIEFTLIVTKTLAAYAEARGAAHKH